MSTAENHFSYENVRDFVVRPTMAGFKVTYGLIAVIIIGSCVNETFGQCVSHLGPLTCPTDFDGPDHVMCCGLPTDPFGQYCCNAAGLEAYEKSSKPIITPKTNHRSPLDVILLYIKHNMGLVIGVAFGIVTLLFIALVACCRYCSCCPYARRRGKQADTLQLQNINRLNQPVQSLKLQPDC